jgi:hypothetical protein
VLHTRFNLLAKTLLLICLLCSNPTWAQKAEFSAGDMRFKDFRQLIEEKNGHQYSQDGTLGFTIKPTSEAKKFFEQPFVVRIFRLNESGTRPLMLHFFLPCEIYISSLYLFDRGIKDSVQLTIGPLGHIGWLHPEPGQPLKPGRYLLVFEPKASEEQVLRLTDASRAAYFSAGMTFTVNQKFAYSQMQIDDYVKSSRLQPDPKAESAGKNRSDITCFTAKKLADNEAHWNVDMLAACSEAEDDQA